MSTRTVLTPTAAVLLASACLVPTTVVQELADDEAEGAGTGDTVAGDGSGDGSSEADGSSTSAGSTSLDTGSGDSVGDSVGEPLPDLPSGLEPGVHFSEVAAAVGIDHSHGDGFPLPGMCLIDTLVPPKDNFFCAIDWSAAGAAAADVDGDGWVDLFVTRLFEPSIFYRNRGDGSFEDASAELGLTGLDHAGGAAWADFDNDGDLDLYLSSISDLRHRLLINHDGWFVDEADARGASLESGHPLTGTSVAPGDYDNDGWLDLYVGDWRNSAIGDFPSHARLLHNRGGEQPAVFDDLTDAVGVNVDQIYLQSYTQTPTVGTFVLTPAWADLDGDGWVELLMSADFGCSRLFWNQGAWDQGLGSFLDTTYASGLGTDRNGMGLAIADYDRDGDLDWFVTSIMGPNNDGNRLYHNLGDRSFADHTDLAGVRDGYWGWGAVFFDQDHDGDLDLAMTNGWRATLHLDDPMVSWTNPGDGAMIPNPPELGLVDQGQGRGLISFDYDRDGDLDLFVANQGGEPKLFRNDSVNDDHWLQVEVRGTISNRDGLGARVEVEANGEIQLVEIGGGHSSYLGHSQRVAHFGLGPATTVSTLRVRWPASGLEQVLTQVPADQALLVIEG